MAVITSTGTLLAVVAAQPATVDAAGFGALTFVNVGEVTDLPEYGASAEVVTHQPLATGITQKYKGFINNGSMSVSVGYSADDAGQNVLALGVTGINKNVEHSFRVTYQDGSIDYFTGKIFSYTKAPGSANSVVSSTVQIEINSVIVEV
jgi:hypothetical protein